MLLMPPAQRQIEVRARDAGGTLLAGTVFVWTEDGQARGRIEPSDGHASLRPISADSVVEIVATYEGRELRRKLLSGQILCEFEFFDINAAATPGASDSKPGKWWSQPPVLAAALALIGTLVVGYWQFGPKTMIDDDKVSVVVYVKDADSQAPIPNATVTIEGAGLQSPSLSDSQGVAHFALPKGKAQTVTVIARAKAYVDGSLLVSVGEHRVQVLLRPQKLQPLPPKPANTGVPTKAPIGLAGTWEVTMQGDLGLKRIRSGTADLTTRPDGRFGLAAKLDLDGSPMRASGEVSRQGERLYIEFDGVQGAEHWKGSGQMSIAGNSLQGYIKDSKGQEIPLTLRKP